MFRRTLTWPSVLVLVCVTCSLVPAEDWPRFRGANGTGVSSSTGLPSEIGPGKNVLWSIDAPAGTSSPVIVQGKLYLTSFAGAERTLHCLDAATGKELWQQSVQKTRDENLSPPNGPATCTPAADEHNVVVFYQDTALLCYSDAGQLRWRAEVGPFRSMHGIAGSPIIVDDKVILLADQLQGSYIAAFSLASGEQVWKAERADGLTGAYTTPSAAKASDGSWLVLAAGTQGLSAYRAADGEIAFTVPGVSNSPVTVPVITDTAVCLCEPVGTNEPMSTYSERFDTNKDGKLALDEVKNIVSMYRMLEGIDQRFGNGDGVVEDAEWNAAFGSMLDKGGLVSINLPAAGGGQPPQVQWNYQKDVPYVASPVNYNGIIYLVCDGGVFKAIQAADGKELKEVRLKKSNSRFYASAVAADGKVFVSDVKGRMTVLKADPSCEELSAVDFKEDFVATPAICDGRIFVRTKSKLYCFSVSPQSP
jgi:outer membrane protein assembly factor BamB